MRRWIDLAIALAVCALAFSIFLEQVLIPLTTPLHVAAKSSKGTR